MAESVLTLFQKAKSLGGQPHFEGEDVPQGGAMAEKALLPDPTEGVHNVPSLLDRVG